VTFTVERARDKEFNSTYTIFLINALNHTNYSLIDDNYRKPKLNMGANVRYIRGPDQIAGPVRDSPLLGQ
jgi:hypothetical protein